MGELSLDAGAGFLVLLERFEQTAMIVLQSTFGTFGPIAEPGLLGGEFDLVEVVEALVDGGQEAVLFDGGVGPGVTLGNFGHGWVINEAISYILNPAFWLIELM